MHNAYYSAAWTDSDCLCCCEHQHQTVTSAVACINTCGGFVLAFAGEQMRPLNESEMTEFQHAMFGNRPFQNERFPNGLLSLLFMF
jgi:hypothetical protein